MEAVVEAFDVFDAADGWRILSTFGNPGTGAITTSALPAVIQQAGAPTLANKGREEVRERARGKQG